MAEKSSMKIILGIGAVAAAAGLGYYFYNKSKAPAVAGLAGPHHHHHHGGGGGYGGGYGGWGGYDYPVAYPVATIGSCANVPCPMGYVADPYYGCKCVRAVG
jgi:hypothetical protein